jgi:hypothetical protein
MRSVAVAARSSTSQQGQQKPQKRRCASLLPVTAVQQHCTYAQSASLDGATMWQGRSRSGARQSARPCSHCNLPPSSAVARLRSAAAQGASIARKATIELRSSQTAASQRARKARESARSVRAPSWAAAWFFAPPCARSCRASTFRRAGPRSTGTERLARELCPAAQPKRCRAPPAALRGSLAAAIAPWLARCEPGSCAAREASASAPRLRLASTAHRSVLLRDTGTSVRIELHRARLLTREAELDVRVEAVAASVSEARKLDRPRRRSDRRAAGASLP